MKISPLSINKEFLYRMTPEPDPKPNGPNAPAQPDGTTTTTPIITNVGCVVDLNG
jgi:hypothetical protein